MAEISGKLIKANRYDEESRLDLALAINKICCMVTMILFPLSLFRLLTGLSGLWEAIAGVLLLVVLWRRMGPANLLVLDEVICRVFPSMRAAGRFGRVMVRDLRLLTAQGREIVFLLRVDLRGAEPYVGDALVLGGRFQAGTFMIEHGRSNSTGHTFSPHPTYSYMILLIAGLLCGSIVVFSAGGFHNIIVFLLLP